MKNENVHMQALHRKLDVVLVQILRSETDYSFREDLPPPRRTPPSTQMQVSPSDPFSTPLFFRSTAPVACHAAKPLGWFSKGPFDTKMRRSFRKPAWQSNLAEASSRRIPPKLRPGGCSDN